jgi:hypothetical protein
MMRFSLSDLHSKAQERPPGYVEDVLAHATVVGEMVEVHGRDYARLLAKYRTRPERALNVAITKEIGAPHPEGSVGTELKALLSRIGIVAAPNCSCNKRAAIMDASGPAWCAENIETIVCWLREEALKRGLPFFDTVARALIRTAIFRARRTAKSRKRA